ncbi:hypothetical protein DFH29DRAFT_934642 [Suillus ampliporus]|nr:hypothetical protein DFH29DRAFT_934642 [Suillus ampliporus]
MRSSAWNLDSRSAPLVAFSGLHYYLHMHIENSCRLRCQYITGQIQHRVPHVLLRLLLVFTIFISTAILALCWAFIICLWHKGYVVLSDPITHKIMEYFTELTLISTVISTILSVTTTALFSFAVKHALSHYITQPISLVKLHTAIALTKPQPLLRWDHRKLSLVTLAIVGLVALLNSSWTTLLLPTLIPYTVYFNAKDLDLGSPAFDARLGLDMYTDNGSLKNFKNIIDIMVPMSGISATRLAVAGGNDSVFAFNGVSYTESSSGIVPAVEEYAGTSSTTGNVGLEYYGGKVIQVNSTIPNYNHSGLYRYYTVVQQGLSAYITCSALKPDNSEYSLKSDNITIDSDYGIMVWNGTAHCPLGSGSGIWLTGELSNDDPYNSNGLLEIIVCPDPGSANVTSFDIFLQGQGGYSFLNTTVCNVSPYVASFDNNSVNVTTFISSMVSDLSFSSQTVSNTSTQSSMNDILENYFRGIVEFSATYLRSAYSAQVANTTMQDLYSNDSAFKFLNGTMIVLTIGWSSQSLTYIYLLGVLTVIWAITVSAAAYSLIQGGTRSGPLFDVSNPVHLMMASSGGGLENLAELASDGVNGIERVRVRLLDDHGVAHDDAAGEKKSARARGSKMRFTIEPEAESNIPK